MVNLILKLQVCLSQLNSSKEPPLALTLLASKNRFDFVNLEKLVQILQEKAQIIENKFLHHPESTSDIRNNLTK